MDVKKHVESPAPETPATHKFPFHAISDILGNGSPNVKPEPVIFALVHVLPSNEYCMCGAPCTPRTVNDSLVGPCEPVKPCTPLAPVTPCRARPVANTRIFENVLTRLTAGPSNTKE